MESHTAASVKKDAKAKVKQGFQSSIKASIQKNISSVRLCLLCDTALYSKPKQNLKNCEDLSLPLTAPPLLNPAPLLNPTTIRNPLLCTLCEADCCGVSEFEWQDILERADVVETIDCQHLAHLFCVRAHQFPYANWIARYKYQADLMARQAISDYLLANLFDDPNDPFHNVKIDLICPVPLHWFKQWRRGFNQAAFIAKTIANETKYPYAEVCSRIKYTRAQMRSSGAKRRRQMKQAFKVDASAVKGKHIMLVDDVVTTGSTLNELAHVLIQNGAIKVSALVLTWAKFTKSF